MLKNRNNIFKKLIIAAFALSLFASWSQTITVEAAEGTQSYLTPNAVYPYTTTRTASSHSGLPSTLSIRGVQPIPGGPTYSGTVRLVRVVQTSVSPVRWTGYYEGILHAN